MEGSQSPIEQGQAAVSNVASTAQETVRSQVDQRSTQAGEQASSLASDLRSVGEQLRSQENENGAKVADQVADRAERAGSYLKDADADTILNDVEDLARRQPWLALAGGVALGVAAARFLKASSSSRYQARQTSYPSTTPTAGTLDAGYASTQTVPPATAPSTGRTAPPPVTPAV